MGYVAFFENFIQIVVLLFAWVIVLLAFFILAVQLFVTLIEFKLTTLAGFVLIPFGLFGKTAFLAERVLGNVISSGVKVLVLAVIVGIGSTLFAEFTRGFGGKQPTIEDAMAIVLAALSLLGLGIFGPGIANGLVSGGPQLGAGAPSAPASPPVARSSPPAAPPAWPRGAGAALGGDRRRGARRRGRRWRRARPPTGSASAGQSGAAGVASGLGGVARAGAGAAAQSLKRAAALGRGDDGRQLSRRRDAAVAATGGTSTMGTIGGSAASAEAPATSAAHPPGRSA